MIPVERKTTCGSSIDKKKEIKKIYRGKVYYFCEEDCLVEFLVDPEKYILSDHFLIPLATLENSN